MEIFLVFNFILFNIVYHNLNELDFIYFCSLFALLTDNNFVLGSR